MIQLDDVRKSFGGQVALGPISLEIPAGKTTVLIGPSGCGKSTLLRLLIGLIRPDDGKILVEGAELASHNILEIRRKIGYVIQEGGLFPHLTARQNVVLVAKTLGWEPAQIERRVSDLASLTQFPFDGLGRYPLQLSGGQRQRVSLMRALMLDPHVLLLDEPLGALDPMIRADLQSDLKDIFARLGKTVVMVTHDLGEAMLFGDAVVLLREGGIVQQGSPQDVISSPADEFVRKFIFAQRSPLESLRGPSQ